MSTHIIKNVELTRIFKELKSKNAGIQNEASRKLYQYLLKHNEDCDDIFEEFYDLLQSNEKENKIGCFIAINKILTVGRETRIVHYVNKIMPMMFKQMKINNQDLVEKAAECLGNLAKAGGSITAETVEKTLDQAINWLAGDKNNKSNDIKKYSAVLVLREFCKKLPIVTFNKFFDASNQYKLIISAFRDHRQNVRDTAAECINECLRLIQEREQTHNQSLLQQIYDEISQAFKEQDVNFQHSALTVLNALISSKGPGNEIIKKQGSIIIENVMKLNETTKSPLVKRKCIEILPNLAKYIQEHFDDVNLEKAVKSLFSYINKKDNKDRGQGFIALGKLSLLVPKFKFVRYLKPIFEQIDKEILSHKQNTSSKPISTNHEVLQCIKMMMRAFGEEFDKRIDLVQFINDMFYSGFNKQLIDTLAEISHICKGKYKTVTQIKLLNAVSIILTQKISYFPLSIENLQKQTNPNDQAQQFVENSNSNNVSPSKLDSMISNTFNPGSIESQSALQLEDDLKNSIMPEDSAISNINDQIEQRNKTISSEKVNSLIQQSPALKIDYVTLKKLLSKNCSELLLAQIQGASSQPSEASQFSNQKTLLVTLALGTLATYDFSQFSDSVTHFIENSVLNYLDDENPQVRKEAVKTCCSLSFSQQHGQGYQRLGAVMVRMVNKLLHKFFVTATTDNDYRIRCTMLKYLNSQFDPFISKYENLLMLFNCMQDSNFDIKDRTIRILGRLVPHNPSQILPYLRHLIVSLISQLEHSHDTKEREEAAKLIKSFVKSNKNLSKSYANSILKSLIQKIDGEQATSAFISAVLEAIGEISNVDSESVKPYMGELFPLILECIKDQSSAQKREVAIKTLISIVENTGFVIKPYFFFPEILTIIRNLVQIEQSVNIKKLVFKLIGTLGALDPYLVKQITLYYNSPDGTEGSDIHSTIPMMHLIDSQLWNSQKSTDTNPINNEINMYNGPRTRQQQAKQVSYLQNLQQRMTRKWRNTLETGSNNPDYKNDKDRGAADLMTQASIKYLKQYDFQETKENKYPTKAIEQLIKVLLDPTLRDHHHIVLQGIKYIVYNLGQDSIVFLPLIIPPIMILIQTNDPVLNESLYQCINAIIGTVPKAIDKFSDLIFDTINDILSNQSHQVLELIRLLNVNCKDQLITEMYLIIPKVLQLIELKKLEDIEVSIKAVQSLGEFHIQILNDHLYLIVPLLLRVCSNGITPSEIKLNIEVLHIFDALKDCPTFKEHVAQIVHQLLQVMETQVNQAQFVSEILKLFCSIAKKLTVDFAPYISLIQKSIRRNRLQCDQFEDQIEAITKINSINLFYSNLQEQQKREEEQLRLEQAQQQQNANNALLQNLAPRQSMMDAQEIRKKHINFDILLKEFDTSKCSIEADWIEWLKKTSNQLLKQSPSPILYACSTLAEVYAPIATELYNIAFVSCWKIMSDKGKEKIMDNYLNAIRSPSKPTIVLQTILNLAEFMELDESTDIKLFAASTLAKIAEQCNAYAKALYYWELEFENDPKNTIELLIQTNYGLQQPEAAEGILEYAKKNILIDEKEDWYEKLHRWRDALRIYEQKEINDPMNFEILKGKLNCFRNLSDWDNLSHLVEQMWDRHHNNEDDEQIQKVQLKEISEQAAYSALNLRDWDNFAKYVKILDTVKFPYERSFYQAILLIQNNKYSDAQKHVDRAREVLDPKITSLLGESYNRAYMLIQEMQNLRELEEIIEYKTIADESRKDHLYSLWCKRLEYQPTQDFEMWQKSLIIRSLVIDKSEEIDYYLKFAKLAQDGGNIDLGQRVLHDLKNELRSRLKEVGRSSRKLNNQLAKVEFAIFQNIFNSGHPNDAIQLLNKLVIEKDDIIEPQLKSECFLKLGEWMYEAQDANKTLLSETDYQTIISNCEKAATISPKNQEAWHYYSLMNYDACIFYSKKFSEEQHLSSNGGTANQNNLIVQHQSQYIFDDFSPQAAFQILSMQAQASSKLQYFGQKYVYHVVCAMKGLVQQLSLSNQMHSSDMTKTLQNTLRLIKLWYRHGNLNEIELIVREGFEKIDLKTWINVIPQLLARVDIKDTIVRKQLIDLLEKISQKFPQALVYSLSVLSKSKTLERRKAADQLIDKLKQKQPILIEQATLISDELIRCAILLAEIWNEAIEEASRIFFGQNDTKTMINYLAPYHKMMESLPETMNEISFYQGYASDLQEAESWSKRYQITKSQQDINQAWDLYLNVFRRISAKQKEVQFYELKNVAPKLLASVNLDIAVPGTFKSDRKIVKIAKFASVLPVLSSKQHPRKFQVYGSDGREYMFLLKGHEDIRQDERVMQLFGLVNTLLSIDPQTSKKDLSIKRYSIIPLSQNSGLIGWVPNCDTLHQLIKEHRQQANIIPNIEYKLMETMCEHFDICALPNKVEIFRYALDKTMGEDLQKVLWLKSQNSELWLERRTNYTRSLAVMSMVGYILGLGDRHPSNIMLDRYSGKIIHIDFGDCFEIAMRREKFPEKIPFRLTRMLIKAMEVSGIEGNFRTTCENTMRVMRDNKESLLAILEAFVYDPLISFKLLNPKLLKQHQQQKNNQDTNNHPNGNDNKSNGGVDNAKQTSDNVQTNDKGNGSTSSRHKSKRMSIRNSIVENVLEKYQKPLGNKEEVNQNYAESKFSRKVEAKELMQLIEEEGGEDARRQELNQTAEIVIQRISDKLRGLEFHNGVKFDTESQVDSLIKQATSHENLAQCYIGWCPFW